MYDRPDATELIEAARMHLETAVIPAVKADRKLYFQTLVAINVLKIVEREHVLAPGHAAAEWTRLNDLEDTSAPVPPTLAALRAALADRNAQLCADIRSGKYDEAPEDLFDHLKATVIEQLEVANPRFLARLTAEDADPSRDAWYRRGG
ncbi:MAG: DUF6285 domain-containing protein [Chloroflexota bacterium]